MADQGRNYLDQISHASSWLSQIFRALAICFASVYTHFGPPPEEKCSVLYLIYLPDDLIVKTPLGAPNLEPSTFLQKNTQGKCKSL